MRLSQTCPIGATPKPQATSSPRIALFYKAETSTGVKFLEQQIYPRFCFTGNRLLLRYQRYQPPTPRVTGSHTIGVLEALCP